MVDSASQTRVVSDAPEVDELLRRSHRLGADPRVTNFGGGNTSSKSAAIDPVTGDPVMLLHVKGSGGDLGTLSSDGLAVLDVGRLRGLKQRYRGPDHEDEMVSLFDHCAFGPPGAAPSIDTAMHGLLPCAHVDHLHPDAVIALATAVDGEQLTKECFGDEVGWIPWRRPGFELGLQIEQALADSPQLRGVVLGGHGLTTWANTSEACEQTSFEIIARAEAFLAEKGCVEPFGPVRQGFEALPAAQRRRRSAQIAPVLRGLCSTDRRVVGHFIDTPEVLDFLARTEAPRLAALGTSCPDHFLRTKIRPLLLDLPATASFEEQSGRLRELHAEYREEYSDYYRRHATEHSPAMRGADPAVVLLPGIGMWTFGADVQTARVAGAFYLNAIAVMRGAESVSSYEPIPEAEKFAIEYWALEEAKLARRPKPKPLTGRVALITGAGSGIGKATALRFADEGAVVVAADLDANAADAVVAELGADSALAVTADVSKEDQVDAAFEAACLAYGGVDLVVNNAGLSLSRPLLETTAADWDLQHDVMARGSFLVSRAAARVITAQGVLGGERAGDIVYVVSKNAIAAGPENIAYSTAKADQAHQVRLLAAELGPSGIRVNGVNPDGVVRGSGIFANGWGVQRAAVYGVPVEELGEFYAGRTLLKKEILPDHVAAAIFVLASDDLSLTTGALLPVDGGVPLAFLR